MKVGFRDVFLVFERVIGIASGIVRCQKLLLLLWVLLLIHVGDESFPSPFKLLLLLAIASSVSHFSMFLI